MCIILNKKCIFPTYCCHQDYIMLKVKLATLYFICLAIPLYHYYILYKEVSWQKYNLV